MRLASLVVPYDDLIGMAMRYVDGVYMTLLLLSDWAISLVAQSHGRERIGKTLSIEVDLKEFVALLAPEVLVPAELNSK